MHPPAALAVPPQVSGVEPDRIGWLAAAGGAVGLDIGHRMDTVHPHYHPVLAADIARTPRMAGRMPLADPHAITHAEARRVHVRAGVRDGRREHRPAEREPA